VFTKVLAPLVALARREGLFVFPYLDDWLQKYSVKESLTDMLQRLIQILLFHGFLINLPKSSLTPSQNQMFIGGQFQTDWNLISLPREREEKLISLIKTFRLGSTATARRFLQLLGFMVAMIVVVRFCRLQMRPVQMYLMALWNLQSMST
jgi:hypothetical protein